MSGKQQSAGLSVKVSVSTSWRFHGGQNAIRLTPPPPSVMLLISARVAATTGHGMSLSGSASASEPDVKSKEGLP